MPFITEELWQNLRERLPQGTLDTPALIVSPYPVANSKLIDLVSEQAMETVMEVVRTIRNARAEYKVDLGQWVESSVYAGNHRAELKDKAAVIEILAKTRPLHILPRDQRPSKSEKSMVYVLKNADVVIPLEGMVDIEAERARLSKEMGVLEREIARLTQRLGDDQFTSRAPAAVIEKERSRLKEYGDKFNRMKSELQQLG